MRAALQRTLLKSSQGFTLIEIVIGVGIIGTSIVVLLGAFSTVVIGTFRLQQNTTMLNLARSQLELVQSQPYSDSGTYPIFSPIPEGHAVDLGVETINLGLLQKITVTASGDEDSLQLETYKTNRLLETGLFPPSGGIEITHSVPITSPLPPKTGFYFVVDVVNSVTPGKLIANWQVEGRHQHGKQNHHHHHSDIQLAVYEGRPFGEESSGVSRLLPEDLASFTLSRNNREPQGITTDGDNLWVVDGKRHDDDDRSSTAGKVFQYSPEGLLKDSFSLDNGNSSPKGITTDGTHLWVVSRESGRGRVFQYTTRGTLVGKFTLDGANQEPEGIDMHRSKIWVVNGDKEKKRVFRYSITGNLQDSFALDPANRKPRGITTNGATIWVVDGDSHGDRVFQYKINGTLIGSFALDRANERPGGLTIDGTRLWVVGKRSDNGQAFQYTIEGTLVRAPILATGKSEGPFIRVSSPQVPAITYTLYFFNRSHGDLFTLLEPVNFFPMEAANQEPQGITGDGTHLWVVDAQVGNQRVFQYTTVGDLKGTFALNSNNVAPKGITLEKGTGSDDDHILVVDGNTIPGRVFRYATTGDYVNTSLISEANSVPRGITTDGEEILVVDGRSTPDRLFRYFDSETPSGSFVLDPSNRNPQGVTADGSHIWVVNGARHDHDDDDDHSSFTTDNVFKYTIDGDLVGIFALHPSNQHPRGIETDGSFVWIADDGDHLDHHHGHRHGKPDDDHDDDHDDHHPSREGVFHYRLDPAAIVTCVCP